MKGFGTLTFAAVVFSAILVGAQSKEPPGGTGAIDAGFRALSEQFNKALLARDAKTLAGLYSEDGVEMRPDMPALKGRAAIQQFYEKLFPTGHLEKLSTNHTEMRAFGDSGYDVGTFSQTFTAPNGKPTSTTGKYIAIVKRLNGTWKIAYLSLSFDSPPQATSNK
jgi:uncharacterized protein (TIGR02246 family)